MDLMVRQLRQSTAVDGRLNNFYFHIIGAINVCRCVDTHAYIRKHERCACAHITSVSTKSYLLGCCSSLSPRSRCSPFRCLVTFVRQRVSVCTSRHTYLPLSRIKPMLINCNSVKSTANISQLQATLNSTNPDILFLLETKLDSSIPAYSFLPTDYEAIRKDHIVHGGGILIALRNDIIEDPQDNLNTTCEMVWTKVHYFLNSAIYLASYNRPHVNIQHHWKPYVNPWPSSTEAANVHHLNLPDINWVNQTSIYDNPSTATKHNKLLEIVSEYSLTNMVNEPIRLDKEISLHQTPPLYPM